MSVLHDTSTDVAFISETWLSSQKNKTTAVIKEYEYSIKHVVRDDSNKERGGGVGIVIKNTIKSKPMKTIVHKK